MSLRLSVPVLSARTREPPGSDMEIDAPPLPLVTPRYFLPFPPWKSTELRLKCFVGNTGARVLSSHFSFVSDHCSRVRVSVMIASWTRGGSRRSNSLELLVAVWMILHRLIVKLNTGDAGMCHWFIEIGETI